MRFYRRSLTRITGALADAGFVVEKLVEPVPTPEFRAVKPESYQRLLERPEFLIVQARVEAGIYSTTTGGFPGPVSPP